jgi:hypothetical protein
MRKVLLSICTVLCLHTVANAEGLRHEGWHGYHHEYHPGYSPYGVIGGAILGGVIGYELARPPVVIAPPAPPPLPAYTSAGPCFYDQYGRYLCPYQPYIGGPIYYNQVPTAPPIAPYNP